MVVRLNSGEVDSHPRVPSSINHFTQSFEVLTCVGNFYPDFCFQWKWFPCVHAASKQAQVAGLFSNLSLRLQIGQLMLAWKD
jgi:hypothetical protein